MDTTGLLPHQGPAAQVLLRSLLKRRGALDASSTGTGKTFTSLAVARQLGRPVAVICPKAVVPAWERAAAHLGVVPAVVTNYERARRGVPGLVERDGDSFRWLLPPGSLTIFDECHACKAYPPSLNARLLRSCFDQGHHVLLLSATLASDPEELWAAGWVLSLWRDGFELFLERVGGWREGGRWRFDRTAMRRLHWALFPERGVRLRHADISGFPKNTITAEAVDFGAGLARIYAEMDAELAALAEREAASPGREDPRVIMLRGRQRAELMKVPAMATMARELVAKGRSVALFVGFDATVTALGRALGTDAVIRGGQSPTERQAIVDGFNANPPASRVIVCNIQAGGVGISLHDTHGRYPRTAIVCPGWSAVHLRQAIGRCHRAGGGDVETKIVFAQNTPEEVVMRSVRAKLKRLDKLNDGDLAG